MISFINTYLYWHYVLGAAALLAHVRHYLAFIWRIFAVPTLLRTLVSPWHRLQESYGSGFNLSAVVNTFIVNILMRLVGLVVRVVMIIFAVVTLATAAVLAVVSVILWLLLPVVWLGLLIMVVKIII
ncbi:MAG: hypothetical protein WD552_03045 [Candidatus Paceibacterota bacterium]